MRTPNHVIVNRTIIRAFGVAMFLIIPLLATAQDPSPSPDSGYVSRAEYDKLKAEHDAMKQELEALKAQIGQLANGTMSAPATTSGEGKQVVTGAPPQAATDELRQEVETLKSQVKETFPGTT